MRFLTWSRTLTEPCVTRVVVEVQVSDTSHLVPRTVAARVAALGAELALAVAPQLAGLGLLLRRAGGAAPRAVERLRQGERGDPAGLAELEHAVVELRHAAVGARDLDRAAPRVDLGAVAQQRRRQRHELPARTHQHRARDDLRPHALPGHRRAGERERDVVDVAVVEVALRARRGDRDPDRARARGHRERRRARQQVGHARALGLRHGPERGRRARRASTGTALTVAASSCPE